MIPSLLLPLLLAASSSAQVTTSFRAPVERLGDNKRPFYGSVVGINGSATTLALAYGNSSVTKIPGHPFELNTVVVGPTTWADNDHISGPVTASATFERSFQCVLNTASSSASARAAGATCTASWSPAVASRFCSGLNPLGTLSAGTYAVTETLPHPSHGTVPASVKTLVRTIVIGQHSAFGEKWCTNQAAGIVTTRTFAQQDIRTYQVVITAGQSSLTASQGATATATVSGSGATGAATVSGGGVSQASNPAAPMMTAAPKMIWLGAAVAAVFV